MKWLNTRIKSNRKSCWITAADFDIENTSTFPDSDFSKYKNKSIIKNFENVIDNKMMQNFVVKTRK